jgi:ADP-ribosylglycohydrolase
MRAHPLGIICIGKSLEETFQIAIDYSVVTHADPRCVVACCIHTALIRGILRGEVTSEEDVGRILEATFTSVEQWQQNGRLFNTAKDTPRGVPADVLVAEPALDRVEFDRYVNASSFEELQLDSAREIGYVYKALGSCILCLRLAIRHSKGQLIDEQYMQAGTNIFEELITALIMQGGDADTNACIAGAVLGAWIGNTGLPPSWRNGLDHNSWLLHKCRAMEQVLGIDESLTGYDGVKDRDTLSDGGRGLLDKHSLEVREAAFVEMYTKRMKMMAERKAQKESKETGRGWMRGLLR